MPSRQGTLVLGGRRRLMAYKTTSDLLFKRGERWGLEGKRPMRQLWGRSRLSSIPCRRTGRKFRKKIE